ncbi:DUF499 domain-containing protein [Caloramator australicus]|uniref:Glycosyl transferase n=1 Tax=Caloramator australicus RC3 TaxID=857293 RepID=I7LJ49_9CLOT|nr:DUF499 domain-containing protein [Caloramator australicus]CCJ33432.1 FIG00534404: hypothetical protein [Caloramator australicus RC3]
MKTLLELCKPRESVFDETKRDDVLDLTDLIENRINPEEFFEENYFTQGMKILFDTAFKRFHRQGQTGIIKLTQSMGGGKTHNMIALGLLAKYPRIREKILGEKFKNSHLGEIKVVAFTGRESDAPFGIWGSIAEQLGKKEYFKDYYSPLQAPGQTAWVNLLKGEPLLILLDELPPYLENAKSKVVGDTNLAVITTTALANLFNAIAKEELSNVCLVISDLKASYESGSELLQSSFKELEGEINRFALNIEPVQQASDEVYHILRKRLFKELPSKEEINEIANAYKSAVNEARQMGYTSISAEQIYIGIKDSYPFHPVIKDLYARFKENPGFQQTRGLIRLMRIIINQLYRGDEPLASKKYLVNVFDFDLNDHEMFTAITQIKPSLSNAISHDIASNGKAVAEIYDNTMNETSMQEISKLILIASLADVPHALLGLSEHEIIGYLCEPNKDITRIKRALHELEMKAWYLTPDRDGRIYFQNTKNIIAEMNSLIDSYDNESAKKELRIFLEEKFKPILGDCYQKLYVFPPLDEVQLEQDKVSLVIVEPYELSNDLNPDVQKFYEYQRFKNRVMFLTGQRRTMENLYVKAKEYKAINIIIKRMKEERIKESDPQFQKALDKLDKIKLELLQAARETFQCIYYPSKYGLLKVDFIMQFVGNEYNGEKQIREVLTLKHKFTTELDDEKLRKMCEADLFTQKEMRWQDVKDRAATNPEWQWHEPSALDGLLENMLRKGIWRQNGGYVDKGPFPKEKTSVLIQQLRYDEDTGEAVLRLTPQYGDKIYYEIDGPATTASKLVENPNEFKTNELKLSFICVDSNGEHETGEPVYWTNKITVKGRVYDKNGKKILELRGTPNVKIKFTTDGSNPKENGGIYEGEVEIPDDAVLVLAVAEGKGIYSEQISIKIEKGEINSREIDKSKQLTLIKTFQFQDTKSTYEELSILKKHGVSVADVRIVIFKVDSNLREGWIDLTIGKDIICKPDAIESMIDNTRNALTNDGKVNITFEYNKAIFETGQKFLDYIADKKKTLNQFEEREIIQ